MSLRNYFKELNKKKELLDEFHEAILEWSPGKLRGLDVEDEGIDAIIEAFMSIGNIAYRSGDSLLLRYFLDTLLEIEESDQKGIIINFSDTAVGYGLRAIHDSDQLAFSVVIESLSNSIFDLRETKPIDQRLQYLLDLTIKAANAGLDTFSLDVIEAFSVLDEYFEKNGLGVSRISLRNSVVTLVHSMSEGPLKKRVMEKAGRVFGRNVDNQTNTFSKETTISGNE